MRSGLFPVVAGLLAVMNLACGSDDNGTQGSGETETPAVPFTLEGVPEEAITASLTPADDNDTPEITAEEAQEAPFFDHAPDAVAREVKLARFKGDPSAPGEGSLVWVVNLDPETVLAPAPDAGEEAGVLYAYAAVDAETGAVRGEYFALKE